MVFILGQPPTHQKLIQMGMLELHIIRLGLDMDIITTLLSTPLNPPAAMA
jgi:hypothetical protein